MSQHTSLKFDSVGVKHRNVLKRFERIKKLQEQNKWQERSSIFGLPKVKSLKIKVRKSKVAPEETGSATPAAAPAAGAKAETPKAATQAAPASKAAATSKPEKPKK